MRFLALIFMAGCCGGLPTVWAGQGLTVEADEKGFQR